MEILTRIQAWVAGWPTHTKVLLGFACTVLTIELVLRNLAPKSKLYAAWQHGVEAIGAVWSAVLLSIIYFVSVGPIGLGMRALGRDLLDRKLDPKPSFWHAHEPNPLGPLAASRHQF